MINTNKYPLLNVFGFPMFHISSSFFIPRVNSEELLAKIGSQLLPSVGEELTVTKKTEQNDFATEGESADDVVGVLLPKHTIRMTID
jgi:hypothetical protein